MIEIICSVHSKYPQSGCTHPCVTRHGVYNLIEVISSWTEQKLRSILKWICYCCLTPSGQFSINILAKPSYISMRRWWHRICTRQTLTIGFYSASSLKQQTVVCSTRTHCPYSESIFLVPLTPYCWMLCEEKANTNFRVFGLTWPVFEHTILHIRDGHANRLHHTSVENKITNKYTELYTKKKLSTPDILKHNKLH